MSAPINLFWASSNKAKTTQLKYIIESNTTLIKIIPVHVDVDEIQSMDNKVVAQDKIKSMYKYISKKYSIDNFHLICEDTGYSYANANGFPGALIKFYHDSLGNDGICKAHAGSRATNTSCVAYTDGDEVMLFTNCVVGTVPDHPRPCILDKYTGIGSELDTAFVPDYPVHLKEFSGLAYSQLPMEVHALVSARTQSFSDLVNYLIDKINNTQALAQTRPYNLADDNSASDFESDSEPDEFAEALSDNLSLCVLSGSNFDSDGEFD